jgi:exonuclease V gamma subunit
VTLIHEKSKGLEAFDKYVQDAQSNNELSQLLQQIRQQDTENVQRLVQLLQRTGVQSRSSSS